jgi:hypothetical protein
MFGDSESGSNSRFISAGIYEKIMGERSEMTNQSNSSAVQERDWGLSALLDSLWRLLTDVRLLLVAIGLTLLFVLISLTLPQLPDQLRIDPSETSRWLLTAAEERGAVGEVLRSVGLFDLLQSPIFQLALALIGLLLLIQLAFAVGAALQLHRIARTFAGGVSAAGEAWPVPPGNAVHRLRATRIVTDEAESAPLDAMLEAHYPSVSRAEVGVAPPLHLAEDVDAPIIELRILGTRRRWAAWLRPLLAGGLLLCTAGLLVLARQGWEVTAPALEPGASNRFAAGDLQLRYDVTIDEGAYSATPVLAVERGADRQEVMLRRGAWLWTSGLLVSAEPAVPAMLVRTRGEQPALTQPGQSTLADSIGLNFPSAGSEQALLLPRQGAGLRILRGGEGEDAFVVELYRTNEAELDEPLRVLDDQPGILLLDDDEIIDLLPLRAVDVTVRRLAGLPLLLAGVLLSLIGLVGYWLRPGYVLLQKAPWSEASHVLIAQSDRQATIAAIEAQEEEAADA